MKDQPILDYVMKNKRKYAPKGAFPAEAIKRYGTIYTPEFVVEKTVDLAWKYLPKDVDPLSLTWCDPACGDANFLVYVYDRLMKCPSTMNPVEKSVHILTKCLFGIEILKPMVVACKIRLLERHIKTVKESGIPGELNVWDKLNITHGNTIMVPEDVGKWELSEYEGGLLPEEIRNKRYNVVVTNCPYTHLRNLNNRRYSAYPKQRDMAQVFIRWSIDHIVENGIVSMNTTDTWLIKINDGALETRNKSELLLREIIQNNEIETYSQSEESGGFVGTFIVCLSRNGQDFRFNEESLKIEDFSKPGFLLSLSNKRNYNFQNVSISQYCPTLSGNRSKNSQGTFGIEKWRNYMIFGDNGDWHLVAKRRLTDNYQGSSYKIIQTADLKTFINTELEGEIKAAKCLNQKIAFWLVAFLNTKEAAKQLRTYTRYRPGYTGSTYELSNNLWPLLKVPDFDYYKSTYPERFAAYMKWVEENMRNKDAFLDGIDEQFKKLIGETNGITTTNR